MKSIKYLGYYDTLNNKKENRCYIMSAVNKMNYICEAIHEIGYNVQIISVSHTEGKKYCQASYKTIFPGIKLKLFTSLGKQNKLMSVFQRLFIKVQLIYFFFIHVKKDESIIAYHSPGYVKLLYWLKKIKKFRLILEIEEIYSDVSDDKTLGKYEYRLFDSADAYVFPTELLDENINKKKKPSVIIYGTYRIETALEHKKENDIIKCIYAGTFDPRKGGAAAAAAAASFLPKNYCIYILGFGKKNEIENMKRTIQDINKKSKAKVFYKGLLKGDEYIRFLQGCDIGLSTQNPDAAFNDTSFPSKILSYLTNGLRVVTVRIPAIEKSAIGNLLYFYDTQNPENIAKAILSVDFHKKYDSRAEIKILDCKFRKEMSQILYNKIK